MSNVPPLLYILLRYYTIRISHILLLNVQKVQIVQNS